MSLIRPLSAVSTVSERRFLSSLFRSFFPLLLVLCAVVRPAAAQSDTLTVALTEHVRYYDAQYGDEQACEIIMVGSFPDYSGSTWKNVYGYAFEDLPTKIERLYTYIYDLNGSLLTYPLTNFANEWRYDVPDWTGDPGDVYTERVSFIVAQNHSENGCSEPYRPGGLVTPGDPNVIQWTRDRYGDAKIYPIYNTGSKGSFTWIASGEKSIKFDASASFGWYRGAATGIQSYDWYFGDGSQATGAVVTHEYADPGTYRVSLTVQDVHGAYGGVLDTVSTGQADGIFAPAEDEIVQPGRTYTVRFKAPDETQRLNLYLVDRSLSAGGERTLLAENVSALDGKWKWEVPADLLSPSTFIIGVDADNPSTEIQSDRFRVRLKWRLYRVVGTIPEPEYEQLKLDTHSWQFNQDDANMWPESYWNQYPHYYGNLTVGYDPFIGADVRYNPTYFSGQIGRETPTWPSFVRAYGEAGTYTSTQPLSAADKLFNQPNPAAAAFWASKRGAYGGVCYGVSMAMLSAFQDPARFSARWMPNVDVTELASVPLTDQVRDAIHALMNYQWGRVQRSKLNVDVDYDHKTPRDVLESLKLMFQRDVRDLDRILLIDGLMYGTDADGNPNRGGHAVVPLGLDSLDVGVYQIGIFDPNNNPPGGGGFENPGLIIVDSTANSWSYQEGGWPGEVGRGMNLSMDVIYAFDDASTDWPHLLESAPNNRSLGKQKKTAVDAEKLYVSIRGAGGVVTGSEGELSYVAGELVSTLPGGYVSFPYTGRPSHPDAFVVPAGAAYRAAAVPQNGKAAVYTSNAPVTVGFEQSGSDDTTKVDLTGFGLSTVSGAGDLRVLAVVQKGSDLQVFQADSLALDDAAGLRVETTTDSLGFVIGGAASTGSYQLMLQRMTASGVRSFYHRGVPLAANAVHTIRPNWSTLGEESVTVDIDTDSDGNTDDTMVLSSEPLPVGVEGDATGGVLPAALDLQVWPNPASYTAAVELSLPEAADVRADVFDVLGRRVASVHDGSLPAGTHRFDVDVSNLSAGLYLVRIESGSAVLAKSVTVVR